MISDLFTYSNNLSAVEPIDLPDRMGNNPIISAIIILSFIIITLSYRSSGVYFKSMISDIFQTKERASFIPGNNAGLVRMRIIMMMNTFILDSFSIYMIFHYYSDVTFTGTKLMYMIGIFAVLSLLFYMLQYGIYLILGYLFKGGNKMHLLNSTYSSLTSIRGLLLILPVLVAIYYTYSLNYFILIFIFVYFITRLIFICKGVKIFFSGIYSLLYLILYLCTLEIAPLLIIYKGIFQLFEFVELKLLLL